MHHTCRSPGTGPVPRWFFVLLPVLVCKTTLAVETDAFLAGELLGRPTDRSISVNFVAGFAVDAFVRFGTAPGAYSDSTDPASFAAESTSTIQLDGLLPDTRYWYQVLYRKNGEAGYADREERTFHTQRAGGSPFSFQITADDHLYDKKGIAEVMALTVRNQTEGPAEGWSDFFIDLGDTFGDDHDPTTIGKQEIQDNHLRMRKVFAGQGHSSAFFFCLGNHEGESGYWLSQNPPENMAVRGTLARKFYFDNPVPNFFYSGNATVEPDGIGFPENYYAFTWGDALFVVLDAYRGYTSSAKPRDWEWTLGRSQYDWFRSTLESSRARHKFVFAHHVLGETRGGLAVARTAEWGGFASGDTTNYQFDTFRPGWGKPIHRIMKENGVGIFFQGHDHLYARETVDGIVYQTCPMPSDSTYRIGVRDNGDAFFGDIVDGSGHLRVSVDPDSAVVEFVTTVLPRHETAGRRNDSVVRRYSVGATGPAAAIGHRGPSVGGGMVFDAKTGRLELFSESAGRFELRLFDASGRSRLSRTVELSRGANRISIETDLGTTPIWGRLSGQAATRIFAVASIGGAR